VRHLELTSIVLAVALVSTGCRRAGLWITPDAEIEVIEASHETTRTHVKSGKPANVAYPAEGHDIVISAPGRSRVVAHLGLRWYARTLRARGIRAGQSGAVTVVQRVSADLRSILTFTASSWLRFLARAGVIDDARELAIVDADFAEREPALASLARASVNGLSPAGPEHRERMPVELRGQPGVAVVAPLSVAELGFSLHAATVVAADDAAGHGLAFRLFGCPPRSRRARFPRL
jgi:hypothetical protein